MPNRNCIHDTATGELISSTTLAVDSVPEGCAVVVTDKVGIWNTSTLDFDPIPEENVISHDEFTKRVGYERFKVLHAAAQTDDEIAAAVQYFESLDDIDLDSAELDGIMTYIVANTTWTQADADEITGG